MNSKKDFNRRSIFNQLSAVQLLSIYYIVAVTIISLLLALPVSKNSGVSISAIDVLFTAFSAVSVTGLTVVPIAETFSLFGIIVLVIAFHIGGLGVMAIGTLIWLVLGRKIGFKERQLMMIDQNSLTLSGVVKIVKSMLTVLLVIEFIGLIILGTYYLKFFDSYSEAYLHGLFSAVSATTNSGFNILGSSLQMFQNDYFVQFILLTLIIFGAIGFPVIIELKQFFRAKIRRMPAKRFSLFTKLSTLTYFALLLITFLFILFLEYEHYFDGHSWHSATFNSLFQATSTRSAGLTTLNISEFTEQTQLILSVMMFIGASPSSMGGGIRTTTFALVIIFIITYARGQKRVKIFRREVDDEDLNKAVVVTLLAIILFVISVITIKTIEPFSLNSIVFEVSSAFGTSGMSLGITSNLTVFSKLILMFLMFVGRLGIINFLLNFNRNNRKSNIRFPKEKINIG